MQQFQVPQFIDIEDKIIGPLTLKQFFYLVGAGGFGFVGWYLLHAIIFVLLVVPIVAVFVAMAFVKIDGRPFPVMLANAMSYYFRPRLYLWRHHVAPEGRPLASPAAAPRPEPAAAERAPATLTAGKLSDIAWSLDVKEHLGT